MLNTQKARTMKIEFLPYDRALKLKQLGFDEPCFGLYEHGKLGYSFSTSQGITTPISYRTNSEFVEHILTKEDCTAPLFQQAFRWFRENYSLGHQISCPYSSTDFGKNVKITNEGKFEAFITDEEQLSFSDEDFLHDSYEAAELACIDKLIEIIETKQQEQ